MCVSVITHGRCLRILASLDGRPGITRVHAGEDVAFEYRDGWGSFGAAPLAIHEVYRAEGQ